MNTNGWVRRALTRQRIQRGRVVTEDPDEKLVVVVKFGEVAHENVTVSDVVEVAVIV